MATSGANQILVRAPAAPGSHIQGRSFYPSWRVLLGSDACWALSELAARQIFPRAAPRGVLGGASPKMLCLVYCGEARMPTASPGPMLPLLETRVASPRPDEEEEDRELGSCAPSLASRHGAAAVRLAAGSEIHRSPIKYRAAASGSWSSAASRRKFA